MKARLIIIPIDDICRLFRDYTYLTGFPDDAKADTLLFNPTTRGMCLRITSDSLEGKERPEQIKFELKRNFLVS